MRSSEIPYPLSETLIRTGSEYREASLACQGNIVTKYGLDCFYNELKSSIFAEVDDLCSSEGLLEKIYNCSFKVILRIHN